MLKSLTVSCAPFFVVKRFVCKIIKVYWIFRCNWEKMFKLKQLELCFRFVSPSLSAQAVLLLNGELLKKRDTFNHWKKRTCWVLRISKIFFRVDFESIPRSQENYVTFSKQYISLAEDFLKIAQNFTLDLIILPWRWYKHRMRSASLDNIMIP